MGLSGDDMGEVNIFGLDEYGMPAGISPLWGVGIGTVLGTGVPAAVRMATDDPTYLKYDELIGFGAGAVASAVMMFFKGTRAAGWGSLIASSGAGARALEKALMSDDKKAAQAVALLSSMTGDPASTGYKINAALAKAQASIAALHGMEVTQVPSLQGMEINQVPSLQGAGGGVPTLLGGQMGSAGLGTLPPQLLGASMNALGGAGAQAMGQAGVQLNGLGRSYGYSPVYGNG